MGLLFISGFHWEVSHNNTVEIKYEFFAALLFLLLLSLELADKITMKRDLEIAREIQAWLVPSTPPMIPNAEVAFYTRAQNSVAGDYYDAFYPTDDAAAGGQLMLVMADVAGKSVPAALLMATLQASLRTIASEGLPLSELAIRLNHYACAHSLGGQRFTTAVLAEYDPTTRRLAYVNAGHNSPVIRRANSSTERLESGGLPLGITPEATFPSAEVTLQAGDTLVLFTDGVSRSFQLRRRRIFRQPLAQHHPRPSQSQRPANSPIPNEKRRGFCRRHPPIRRHHLPRSPLHLITLHIISFWFYFLSSLRSSASNLAIFLSTSLLLCFVASGFLSHNHSVNSRELANSVCDKLHRHGHQAFLVGGCVRDILLRRDPADYDVATNATPAEVLQLFPQGLDVGAQFGVVLVRHDSLKVEVATFRSDVGYSDGRHPDQVVYSQTPEEDVQRRDFTINGLLMRHDTGEVLDFVGGRADLAAGIIRAIGDPSRRFAEDKLRMLRAVRFAARFGYTIEPATFAAIRTHASEINIVSAERIREELTKLLTEGAARRGFELLDELGLLSQLLPEIAAMKGVPQPPQFHPEGDVWVHTLLMLEGLPAGASPTLAWGVLLHDIGKPPTFRSSSETGDRIRFDGHVDVGVRCASPTTTPIRSSHSSPTT